MCFWHFLGQRSLLRYAEEPRYGRLPRSLGAYVPYDNAAAWNQLRGTDSVDLAGSRARTRNVGAVAGGPVLPPHKRAAVRPPTSFVTLTHRVVSSWRPPPTPSPRRERTGATNCSPTRTMANFRVVSAEPRHAGAKRAHHRCVKILPSRRWRAGRANASVQPPTRRCARGRRCLRLARTHRVLCSSMSTARFCEGIRRPLKTASPSHG